RRRHTRFDCDWSSDVCSSDLGVLLTVGVTAGIIWGLERYGIDSRIGGTWLTIRWITGLVGLVGIAAVMSYPVRKQVYRRRAGGRSEERRVGKEWRARRARWEW